MQNLLGKRIGIILTSDLLKNILLLREIEKIIGMGGEIWVINSQKAGKPSSGTTSKSVLGNTLILDRNFNSPILDLYVIIPSRLTMLQELAVSEKLLPNNFPLVVGPEGGMEILSTLNRLFYSEKIYFIPCGTLGKGKNGSPLVTYRLDLLAATCAAALKGQRLEPSFWETVSFPH